MLVDRDRELDRFDKAVAVAAGGRGMTIVLEGAAGIGKTALLAAVRERAAGWLNPLTARGGELERELAFSIVRQLFEPLLRGVAPAARRELFIDAAGLAAPVFGGSIGLDTVAVPPESSMGSVVHGLHWLCANLAEREPLLLTVDDTHWADEASLRFLSHLARRIADLPVLLVLAGRPPRPGEPGAVQRALSGTEPTTLVLGPLSDGAVAELVRRALPGDPDEAFTRACARATGGNPFLLAEALTALRRSGVRPLSGELDRIETLQVDTISRTVLARMSRLGPRAVRLARAVAVLGPASELRRVAALADLDESGAAETADALVRETILNPVRPLEFVHPLVRTAVYADLTPSLRAVAHKRAARTLAAEALSAEQLAPHLIASEPGGDPWVVAALRAAAADALDRGAPEPAAACLERALAEPPDCRASVLIELGRCLNMLDRAEEAAAALQAALELVTQPITRVEVALQLEALFARTGRFVDTFDTFQHLGDVADGDDEELPLRVHVSMALRGLTTMKPPPSWLARLEQAVPRLRPERDADRMVLATLAFGGAVSGNRPSQEVAELAATAAAGPLSKHDSWVLVNLAGAALGMSGRDAEGLALIDRGIDLARRWGDIAAYAYLATIRSHQALYAGHLVEAEADARAALEIHYDPSGTGAALAAAVLIDALVDRGELDAAQQVLTDRGLPATWSLNWTIAHFIFMARGRLRLQQHRFREGLADLHTCGKELATAGYTNPAFAQWRAEAALAHHALGEVAVARELATEELTLARRFGAPRAIGIGLRALGLITGGQQGVELLRESVIVLTHSTAHVEHARSLIDYGAALRRRGHRTEARGPLYDGLDLATRCGAGALARNAHQELNVTGARPRRALRTGAPALTAAERRVADLVAAGRTNTQVAQALFVTVRTVEVHLTSIYRKLNITSRHELHGALEKVTPDCPVTDISARSTPDLHGPFC
ncbi:MAG TPA: AAA family ATPase [Streptosporangiaceae bacterium]|nr:AAA family ATPase [Streptosporangiaceae bacterium]